MRNKLIYAVALITIVASCGEKNNLEAKKEQLAEYKKEVKELNTKIEDLKKQIAKEDTAFQNQVARNAVLVNVKPAEEREFTHEIEIRGEVESRKNVMLSAQVGGKIESVQVNEGQNVQAGQTLITLDSDIIRNTIAELKTSLELAEAVYQRQSNLWEKKIGTEIQYLEAKNNKEALERKLATAYSQLNQTVIKAPFSGTIDEIPARVGELAQPGMPMVRLVNPSSLYIQADVAERYIGDFKKGDKVELSFPVQNKTVTSTISSVGEVVNQDNRTFSIEVKLPALDFAVKPNQVVVLKLVDYESESAIVVPSEVILSDKEGKYLYTATEKNGAAVAKKTRVEPGRSHNGMTEILTGLSSADKVVTAGYRSLSDGVLIKPVERNTETAQL